MAIDLPGGPGACREIRKCYPQASILVLGTAGKETEEAEMRLAGADTILNKTANMHQIVECIKQLHSAGEVAKDALVALPSGPDLPALKKNEIAVLQLLCLQMDSEGIAKKLFLSKHTVDRLRKALLLKCGVKNTAGLVMFAIKHKLVKAED
jgi:DNA-binding NarL/FixJ family response regulator